ncbi:MAG: hypothetical protein LBR77_02610 [Lachnospiraceae bacterium]|jgi:hypothetical protein|nr:hypothetical protein [Lachnospiraceae bacterium]
MNPFVYGRVAKGECFFDRADETRRIVQTLSGGNNIAGAFYNAAMRMSLPPLPRKDTVDFIMGKMAADGIDISEDAAGHLIDVAGMIPHYIQMLASEVWQYVVNNHDGGKQVTKHTVDSCVKQVIAVGADYYAELYGKQSKSRKNLICALCKDGNQIFSGAYISKNGLGSASTVQRSINQLINAGIVEKTETGHILADPFFQRYVEIVSEGAQERYLSG